MTFKRKIVHWQLVSFFFAVADLKTKNVFFFFEIHGNVARLLPPFDPLRMHEGKFAIRRERTNFSQLQRTFEREVTKKISFDFPFPFPMRAPHSFFACDEAATMSGGAKKGFVILDFSGSTVQTRNIMDLMLGFDEEDDVGFPISIFSPTVRVRKCHAHVFFFLLVCASVACDISVICWVSLPFSLEWFEKKDVDDNPTTSGNSEGSSGQGRNASSATSLDIMRHIFSFMDQRSMRRAALVCSTYTFYEIQTRRAKPELE